MGARGHTAETSRVWLPGPELALFSPNNCITSREETHSSEKHTDYRISPLGRRGVGSVVRYVAFYHPPRSSVRKAQFLFDS